MSEDEDRDTILERRKRLLASALSGVAMGAVSLGAQACMCLSYDIDAEWDSGTDASMPGQDAGPPPDAGPADAGSDASMDAAGTDDAGMDDAGMDDAGSEDAGFDAMG